jgi:hypothetical protein
LRETTTHTFSGGAYYKLLPRLLSNAPNQSSADWPIPTLFDPPKSNYPSNVRMDVTLWGSAQSAVVIAGQLEHVECVDKLEPGLFQLANYDYALLFVDYWQTNPLVPVPMVSGLVGTAQSLIGIGVAEWRQPGSSGGANATLGHGPYKYNPWDFYAYPRIRWNTNYTAAGLESEFFTGYYKEAAAPMLAYYQAMENYQYSNNVDYALSSRVLLLDGQPRFFPARCCIRCRPIYWLLNPWQPTGM